MNAHGTVAAFAPTPSLVAKFTEPVPLSELTVAVTPRTWRTPLAPMVTLVALGSAAAAE